MNIKLNVIVDFG